MALTEKEELELLELERQEAIARMLPAQETGLLVAREAPLPVAPPQPTRLPGQVSELEAFGRGTLAGVTSDFDEELGAAFQAGLEAARRRIEKSQAGRATLEALGFGVTPTQTMAGGQVYKPEDEDLTQFYREGREMGRMEKARAQASAPKSYLGGQVVGAVGQAALLSAAGVPVANLGGAAGMGAVQGLGASEADLTKGELGKAALDTAGGAAFGAVGYGLGKGLERAAPVVVRQLQKAAQRLGLDEAVDAASNQINEALRRFAALRAVKATGAIQKDINKEGRGTAIRKGQVLLREGLIPWSGNKEVIAQNVQAARELAGDAMETILTNADESLTLAGQGFDWSAVLGRINRIRESLGVTGRRLAGGSLASRVGGYAPSYFDDIAQTAAEGGGFAVANRLKSEIANDAYGTLSTKLSKKIAKRVERTLNDEIERQLREVAGNRAAREFTRAKNIYGATMLAEKGLKTAQDQGGNNLFGLGATILGSASSATSAALGGGAPEVALSGLGAALATKLATERGSAVLARGAQALTRVPQATRQATAAATQAAQAFGRTAPGQAIKKVLEQQPAMLGRYAQMLQQAAQRSDKDLAVMDYTLSNQDAEYRKMREELLKANQ
jgi:hypothetical protein